MQASYEGMRRDSMHSRNDLWVEKNRSALESSNAFVEAYGLPLAKYKKF